MLADGMWSQFIKMIKLDVHRTGSVVQLCLCADRLDFSLTEDEENDALVLDLAVYR